MKRELLLSILILEYSIKELTPLSDEELMSMYEELKKKIDGSW